MFAGVQALMAKHEIVGDVRGGHGLMVGLELVSDRDTKTPIDKVTAGKVQQLALDAGVMIRVSGNNIILSPSLILSEADTTTIIDTLDEALAGAVA